MLQLIERSELDITKVSLAKVTDQFLGYLDQVEEIVPEEVADFLVVAAKLIYLKSQTLLPNLELPVEAEAGDLERQLKIYQQYYEASKTIEKLLKRRHFSFVRLKPMRLRLLQGFAPPPGLQGRQLAAAFAEVLERLEEIRRLPKILIAKAVSIKERINELRQHLMTNLQATFGQLSKANNKLDTIVSFLALLELVKQRVVQVDQKSLFKDIFIRLNSSGHDQTGG